MPIYEYKCPKCGNVFEDWARSAEGHDEKACPHCETPSPRIISRTSFVLKGDGWYVSDYGYRKGITEDGGSTGKPPAKAVPTAPATQGSKTLAKSEPASPPAKVEKASAPASTATTAEKK